MGHPFPANTNIGAPAGVPSAGCSGQGQFGDRVVSQAQEFHRAQQEAANAGKSQSAGADSIAPVCAPLHAALVAAGITAARGAAVGRSGVGSSGVGRTAARVATTARVATAGIGPAAGIASRAAGVAAATGPASPAGIAPA